MLFIRNAMSVNGISITDSRDGNTIGRVRRGRDLLLRIEIQFEGQMHPYERVKLFGIDFPHSKRQLPVHSVVEICHG